ncbi:MAG: DUF4430 domain-containing protein [Actinobacteria bacterium]|nr:MAG: DUF4430 domain-containing protein [Actinomycetota bacterium]
MKSGAKGRNRTFPAAIAGILLLGLLLAGCTAAAPKTSSTAAGTRARADLLITRDFGAETVYKATVRVPAGETVLEALSKTVKVETAYGGGFVNSIEGIGSGYTAGGGKQSDWFYYVNGVQAPVGAGERVLHAGDKVWWDYHSWERYQSIPAVIGQFPEPFVRGYGGKPFPVEILYGQGFENEAGELKDALLSGGARHVSSSPLQRTIRRGAERSLILLAEWKHIKPLEVAGRQGGELLSGLPLRLDKDEILMLDEAGKTTDAQTHAGAIAAAGGGDAHRPVVWLVTGTGPTGVRKAADAIIERPEAIAGKIAAVVDPGGDVIALPRRGG